ncbi:noggin-like [Sphaeramia orbicularis]|uniref:noggin-like n=1 Tax=Sphaeramia orbicularis TaxID=375764 RepID=UPI00117FCE7F|nr:noggin-like [Sphaeramia orbicularis]
MSRQLNCGLYLCWYSFSVLLHGPAAFDFNTSTLNQPPNVKPVKDQEIMEEDSPFLQLRARLPSYSQPIRPYSILTNTEDYHYMPKPKHRRPSRLRRLLGSHFDPFWMSVEQPSEGSGVWTPNGDTFNLSASPQLRVAAENHGQKLEKEAAELDFSSLPSDVASAVRDWLVRSATCGLHYQWVNLGSAFWPRWVRHTDCEGAGAGSSCSFPHGMKCTRAQTTYIKILTWHCQEVTENRDASSEGKGHRSEGSTGSRTMETSQMCTWRPVPYPVVTACTCSCK